MKKARYLVSQKKIRTVDRDVPNGSIDLDLTEVHPRIVCMGYPASGIEAMYRNKYEDVLRYLDYKYRDNYVVYNLCKEDAYQYSEDKFHGRIRCFPFYDHNAAPLELMPAFVKDVTELYASNPEAVAVIHCKAGKGRTGIMVCCLLLIVEPALEQCAERVMDYYGMKRTKDGKGLTVPSQRRSVQYFERLTKEYGGQVPSPLPALRIKLIRFIELPQKPSLHMVRIFVNDGEEPHVSIHATNQSKNKSAVVCEKIFRVGEKGIKADGLALNCQNERRLWNVSGDLRFEMLGSGGTLIGVLSVHTLFMEKKYPGTGVDKLGKECSESCCIEFEYEVPVSSTE